ncbi:D-lyxose/D-mannose family sugar isomerase [Terrarubrum flagellatum]|uniref:D-lyxose/D-mannose family sugar isomerase n=1 Tax=Terrirubrum flagellatum TaxID=2895980 RepID=UPI0031456C92
MKRSEINDAIRFAEDLLARYRFALPPFASWTPAEWRARKDDLGEVFRAKLGWDITDYGQGDFAKIGLTLFSIRNGDAAALKRGHGMLYAEKALIVLKDQVCPSHFHLSKTEDIINRGGGRLVLELVNTHPDHSPDEKSEVTVMTDGILRKLPPRGKLSLGVGESVTLVPGLAHAFWAEDGDVFVGEVSTVNDDETDNVFLDRVGRFPTIEEDEPPHRLIVGDYRALTA